MTAWIDGEPGEAVEVDDRGLQYGDGLFETMAVRGGSIRLLDRHLARLAAAAHNLGRLLRKLFGIGKPKALQGEGGFAALVQLIIKWILASIWPAELRPRAASAVAGASAAAA